MHLSSIVLLFLLFHASCLGQNAPVSRSPISGLPSNLAVMRNYTSHRVASEDRAGNKDRITIGAGETTTIAELEGPGEITHLWTTIATRDQNHLRNVVIRIYWDGNDFPSVEAPIGDFYGLGHGRYYYFSNPVQAIGTNKGMNCFWPMPFAKSARITITNEAKISVRAFYFYVDWRKFPRLPENLAYFHAQYRQAFPNRSGSPYLFLETSGTAGHFVGAHLSILTQVAGWWGEGDDIFTIDGEEMPSLWGTGSEDYFSGAWGFGETFYTDYFGMPYREQLTQAAGNYWNVYRLHLESPITFSKSIKFEMEHGAAGFDETRAGGRNNDYSSVAYYYLARPQQLIGPLPPADERIPQFRDQSIRLPGVIEAHRMRSTAPQGMTIEEQEMSAFSAATGAKWLNDNHLWGRGKEGDVARLEFATTEPLQGQTIIHLTKGPDYGIISIALDGEVLLDGFDAYGEKVSTVTISIGRRTLPPGKHELRVTVNGKNPESKNTLWGIDYLRIGGTRPDFEAAPAPEPRRQQRRQ